MIEISRPHLFTMKTTENNEPVILTLSSDEDDDAVNGNENNYQYCPKLCSKEPFICRKLCSKQFTRKHMNVPGSYFDDSANHKTVKPVSIVCRNIRIGSYKAVPIERILFVPKGIQITVPPLVKDQQDKVILTININSVLKILAHFGHAMPVIFIYLLPKSTLEIREMLKMHDKNGFYFDSCSHEESHRRITLMTEKMKIETVLLLKNMLDIKICDINKPNDGETPIFEEVTLKEANEILIKSSPTEIDRPVNSNSQVDTKKTIQSTTLFVYPPAPSKGGITVTTDDYSCLQDEEFLNDVLIDFYLKWLLLSKLSAEDSERTHFFSSFFYRRLTAKPKNNRRSVSSLSEDSAAVSPAVRRHNRVKSWTKNVNIFTKDFLFIPINERSHWFLAVICYPGMKRPVYVNNGHPVSPVRVTEPEKRSSREKKKVETIPVEEDDDYSDRDEASGCDDELEDESDDDDRETHQLPKKLKKNAIKQPCILIFDSMPTRNRSNIVSTLREYLTVEYQTKYKNVSKDFTRWNFPGSVPKVPFQCNYSDCGIFVLQFAEYFFKRPLRDYRLPIKTLSDWFSQDEVCTKRESIAQLIRKLLEEYRPNHNVVLPTIQTTMPVEPFPSAGGRCPDEVKPKKRAISPPNFQRSSKVKIRPNKKISESVRIPGICEEPSEGSSSISTFLNSSASNLSPEDCPPNSSSVIGVISEQMTQSQGRKECPGPSLPKSKGLVSSSNVNKPNSAVQWKKTAKYTEPDYISKLVKSTALQKVLNNCSSLKLLADTYDNSDDTQSSDDEIYVKKNCTKKSSDDDIYVKKVCR